MRRAAPIWKMTCESGSPAASSVILPAKATVVAYTPGPSVRPARGTPERSWVKSRAAQSPKVVAASASDPMANEEPTSKQLDVPGGNPV